MTDPTPRTTQARTNTTLVSVVVPVLDGGAMLSSAIASVEGQVLPPGVDVEVIVVDDGSVDGAPAHLTAQGHDVTILSQDNAGPSAARNVGLAAAQGDLVAFIDADDRWPDDKLSGQLAHLRRSGADISIGHQRIHIHGDAQRPAWLDQTPPWMPHSWQGSVRGQVPLNSMVARRDIFDRVGPFDETLRFCEDVDWILRAMESGLRVEVLDRIVLERGIRHRNLSNNTDDMTRGMLAALSRRAVRTRDRDHRRSESRFASEQPGDTTPGAVSVSVVIPLRHHVGLLVEALESVVGQVDTSAEVVVIDDGSPEADGEVIAEICRQGGVRRVRQPARSAAAARNLGARLVTGSHLLFLDADDRLAPDAIATLTAALRDGTGTSDPVTDLDSTAALGITEEFSDGSAVGARSPVKARVRLLGSMLLPRAAFNSLGGFDETLARGEGLDLIHRAVTGGMTVVETDEVVLRRRIHAANGGAGAGADDYLAVARKAIERSRQAAR